MNGYSWIVTFSSHFTLDDRRGESSQYSLENISRSEYMDLGPFLGINEESDWSTTFQQMVQDPEVQNKCIFMPRI